MNRRVHATILYVEHSIRPTENNFLKINKIFMRMFREMGTIYIWKDHRSDLIMMVYLLSLRTLQYLNSMKELQNILSPSMLCVITE
jgi:hypothetical protein